MTRAGQRLSRWARKLKLFIKGVMKFPTRRMSKKTLFRCVFVLIFVSLVSYIVYDRFIERKNAIATIEPWNFTSGEIADIYVNGQWGGSVHGLSGGGGSICCTLIPKVWRKGLVVTIKWQKSGDEKWYTTIAPVPEYKKTGALQILFLPGDNVQVYINHYWPCTAMHPMPNKTELCKE